MTRGATGLGRLRRAGSAVGGVFLAIRKAHPSAPFCARRAGLCHLGANADTKVREAVAMAERSEAPFSRLVVAIACPTILLTLV